MNIPYHGLNLTVNYTPGDPGVRTLKNGDPGYPPTGPEVEIEEIGVDDPHEWAEWIDPDDGETWVSYSAPSIRRYIDEYCLDDIADLCEKERAR